MGLTSPYFLAICFGVIGGIGNMYIRKQIIIFPRFYRLESGQFAFAFGNVFDLFLAGLAGILVVSNIAEEISTINIFYMSTVAGLTFTAVITSFLDFKTQKDLEQKEEDLDEYTITIRPKKRSDKE